MFQKSNVSEEDLKHTSWCCIQDDIIKTSWWVKYCTSLQGYTFLLSSMKSLWVEDVNLTEVETKKKSFSPFLISTPDKVMQLISTTLYDRECNKKITLDSSIEKVEVGIEWEMGPIKCNWKFICHQLERNESEHLLFQFVTYPLFLIALNKNKEPAIDSEDISDILGNNELVNKLNTILPEKPKNCKKHTLQEASGTINGNNVNKRKRETEANEVERSQRGRQSEAERREQLAQFLSEEEHQKRQRKRKKRLI